MMKNSNMFIAVGALVFGLLFLVKYGNFAKKQAKLENLQVKVVALEAQGRSHVLETKSQNDSESGEYTLPPRAVKKSEMEKEKERQRSFHEERESKLVVFSNANHARQNTAAILAKIYSGPKLQSLISEISSSKVLSKSEKYIKFIELKNTLFFSGTARGVKLEFQRMLDQQMAQLRPVSLKGYRYAAKADGSFVASSVYGE